MYLSHFHRELTITHSEFDLIIEQVRSRVQQVEGFHLAVKQRMAAGLQHKEMECAQVRDNARLPNLASCSEQIGFQKCGLCIDNIIKT